MQVAPLPQNENDRLASLKEYRIIDSGSESQYDDITELASYICGTSVALITFIEKDRQWFKSAYGTEFTETPRDIAFCTHAFLEEDGILIVPDTSKDQRFFDNPLVTQNPNVSFYAGVTLKSETGSALGTICVLDENPRVLSTAQKKALKTLSKQVMKLLELRKVNFEIQKTAEENQRLLANEIAKQTKELRLKNSELTAINEEVEQMVYIASHDLQEPVRKLKIYADLLSQKTLDAEQIKRYLGKISLSADRAYHLVNDILDFARIKSKVQTNLKLRLDELLHTVIESESDYIDENGAIIEVKKLPVVLGDKSQLMQLFDNLIVNAIKYCTQSPKIILDSALVEIQNRSGEPQAFNEITVTDNGIGFDQIHEDRIFDFFQRLHDKNEFSGTGIGLAIVKKIAHNHGGFAKAKSEVGKGSVFSIYLPVIQD